MTFDSEDRLPGESILLTKRANAIIKRAEFDLKPFAGADLLLRPLGLGGSEGIGGKLYLTTFRLVFDSHSINRVTGAFSVFLSTIARLQDTSKLFAKRLAVDTRTQRLEFVIWGVPALIRAIEVAKQALSDEQLQSLQDAVREHPDKIGAGLGRSPLLGDLDSHKLAEIAEKATSLFDALNALSALELLFRS